jgi:hypothetical protein
MAWIVRRLFVVYALFSVLAAVARWMHAPSPWLDGLLAAGAGATLVAMGWRVRTKPLPAARTAPTAAPADASERAVP